MALILAIAVVFVLLVVSEIWWRSRRPHDEFSRKFIHISVGSFVAFWPFFLAWQQIRWLGVAFVVGVVVSKYFKVFTAIHAVERPTYGEVCFALAVVALTYVTHSRGIYMVAVLHMGLADGLAALSGTVYGGNNSYKVWGHKKSLAGSVAFLLCSVLLLVVYATVQPHIIPPAVVLALALGATILENVAVLGLDNLVVPVLLAIALQAAS